MCIGEGGCLSDCLHRVYYIKYHGKIEPMSLAEPTIFEKAIAAAKTIKPLEWKLIGLLVLTGLVIGAVAFLYSRCETYEYNKKTQQANANLANAINRLANIQNQKANVEVQLQQVNVDEAAQKQKVIDAAKDVQIAVNADRDAHIAANEAVSNVNAVNAERFDNTTLANANKARCLAFPSSPECQ